MNINAEGIKDSLKILNLPAADAKEKLKAISGQIKLKSFLTIKLVKKTTEYVVNVSLALLALFLDQLDDIDVPPGAEGEDTITENFRYVKAHFNSPLKIVKTIGRGIEIIEEKSMEHANIEAATELLAGLVPPTEVTGPNTEATLVHEYVVAFLNYYYAFNVVEPPQKKERTSSETSKVADRISNKTKSKPTSQHDHMAEIIHNLDTRNTADPMDEIKLPQEKGASKHTRTRSQIDEAQESQTGQTSKQKTHSRERSGIILGLGTNKPIEEEDSNPINTEESKDDDHPRHDLEPEIDEDRSSPQREEDLSTGMVGGLSTPAVKDPHLQEEVHAETPINTAKFESPDVGNPLIATPPGGIIREAPDETSQDNTHEVIPEQSVEQAPEVVGHRIGQVSANVRSRSTSKEPAFQKPPTANRQAESSVNGPNEPASEQTRDTSRNQAERGTSQPKNEGSKEDPTAVEGKKGTKSEVFPEKVPATTLKGRQTSQPKPEKVEKKPQQKPEQAGTSANTNKANAGDSKAKPVEKKPSMTPIAQPREAKATKTPVQAADKASVDKKPPAQVSMDKKPKVSEAPKKDTSKSKEPKPVKPAQTIPTDGGKPKPADNSGPKVVKQAHSTKSGTTTAPVKLGSATKDVSKQVTPASKTEVNAAKITNKPPNDPVTAPGNWKKKTAAPQPPSKQTSASKEKSAPKKPTVGKVDKVSIKKDSVTTPSQTKTIESHKEPLQPVPEEKSSHQSKKVESPANPLPRDQSSSRPKTAAPKMDVTSSSKKTDPNQNSSSVLVDKSRKGSLVSAKQRAPSAKEPRSKPSKDDKIVNSTKVGNLTESRALSASVTKKEDLSSSKAPAKPETQSVSQVSDSHSRLFKSQPFKYKLKDHTPAFLKSTSEREFKAPPIQEAYLTEVQDQERAAPASARTTAPKAIPSLDEVIKSFKNTGYYKSLGKKTQAPAAPRVNSMERNKNVGFLSKVKARSSVRLESRHVPTFQHENFTHRREEEARKLLGDESHQSETKPAASKKKSVETLFKSFEKKQLRDGLHSQSMTILPHVTSANNRLERITKLKVGAAAGDKPNVESQVRKFQEDFELIKNHVRRKQEEQNPLIRDIEKEKELIRVARLEMNSLLFKMERQRKQELLEQEKQSERELAEFRQKQRLKSIMVDSERYLKEKAERVMYNKAQFEEKRFIKDKINKILKNQFEEEQKLIKATPTKGSKDTKQPQGKDEKDENVSSNNDRLEFRALIEEAAMGHNYPYMKTYQQTRENELKYEKNTFKSQMASLRDEIDYLKNVMQAEKKQTKSVKATNGPTKKASGRGHEQPDNLRMKTEGSMVENSHPLDDKEQV